MKHPEDTEQPQCPAESERRSGRNVSFGDEQDKKVRNKGDNVHPSHGVLEEDGPKPIMITGNWNVKNIVRNEPFLFKRNLKIDAHKLLLERFRGRRVD